MAKKISGKKFWPQKPKKRNFWPKNGILKILVDFFSESIQNVLKRTLNRNSRMLKFFPQQNFSWDLFIFCPKVPK